MPFAFNVSKMSFSDAKAAGADAIAVPNNVALMATDNFVCFIFHPLLFK